MDVILTAMKINNKQTDDVQPSNKKQEWELFNKLLLQISTWLTEPLYNFGPIRTEGNTDTGK